MELIKKSELRNYRRIYESRIGDRVFSEFINESKSFVSKQNKVTIFLSHKHDEFEELMGN